MASEVLDFDSLVAAIERTHSALAEQASKAVNLSLTLRNWFIGYYIQEYEQSGTDRAAYGERLLESLAERLQSGGLKRVEARELRRFRQFYLAYPQIRETVSPELAGGSAPLPSIWRTLSAKLASTAGEIREAASPESGSLSVGLLLERLSFSHFAELLQLDDSLQRRFYEVEALRGNWSVRELRRQIASLYYQRSGLSKDKAKLSAIAHAKAETLQPAHIIRDPYIFEFLGLRSQDTMGESDLEDALLERLQEFLLEMGHGFCFEARQKRILIGGEHFFVDLVFYHRVLKCHILVELKTQAFSHENLGQLNTYVGYYQQHEMSEGDQPPIGILLCTRKNHELVEYALAGMSNTLFVSRYQVQLPGKDEMAAFLHKAVEELGGGDE